MSEPGSRSCTLRLAADGCEEPCLGERCAFWEPGGAVLDGACLVERLGIMPRSGLASYLLEVRQRLEQARDLEDIEAAHREFSRRIGLEL
jgi:hypothetical protein